MQRPAAGAGGPSCKSNMKKGPAVGMGRPGGGSGKVAAKIVVARKKTAAPKEAPKAIRRSSRPTTQMDDYTLTKAVRTAAKRNLETSGMSSFPSFSDSVVQSRISNLGVSLGRDNSEVGAFVVLLKNIEFLLNLRPHLSAKLVLLVSLLRMRTLLMLPSTTLVVFKWR